MSTEDLIEMIHRELYRQSHENGANTPHVYDHDDEAIAIDGWVNTRELAERILDNLS